MSDRGHRSRGRGNPRGRGGGGNQRSSSSNQHGTNSQQFQNSTNRPSSGNRRQDSYGERHGFEIVPGPNQLPPQHRLPLSNQTHPPYFEHPLSHLRYSLTNLQDTVSLLQTAGNALMAGLPPATGIAPGYPRAPAPPQQIKHQNRSQQQSHVSQDNKNKHQNKLQQQPHTSQGDKNKHQNKPQQPHHASQDNKNKHQNKPQEQQSYTFQSNNSKHQGTPQQSHTSQGNKNKLQNSNPQKLKPQFPNVHSERPPFYREKHPEHIMLPPQRTFDHSSRMVSPTGQPAGWRQNTVGPNIRTVNPQHQPVDLNKKQKRKRYRKKYPQPNTINFWRNKENKRPQECGSQPQNLFTFSRVSKASVSTVVSEDSDDDSMSVASTHSSVINTELSSSDESEESMQSSLFSRRDHVADLADFEVVEKSGISTIEGVTFQNRSSNIESHVSVFWDIENCPVPSTKSAIDIVKKIRNVFYDNRTEEEFIVACDTRNLDRVIDRELTEAHVTIIHANSQNKNAADSKLRCCLQKFQQRYRLTNSAIVLVSGDSDFSDDLHELRYQHKIYINVICNEHSRKALREAAQRCVEYSDFIRDLPERAKGEELMYYLVVSNLPNHVKSSAIKTKLAEKIKSINGKVKKVSSTEAELIFMNHSACEKAFKEFQGCSIYDSQVVVSMETRSGSKMNVKQGRSKIKSITAPLAPNSFQINQSEKLTKVEPKLAVHEKFENKEKVSSSKASHTVDDQSKKTTVYVFVSQHPGNQEFWEKKFKAIFKEEDLIVQWLENEFERYFLVTFPSLSKAQKAKKVLLKTQTSDPTSPRFIKIVKGSDFINLPVTENCDLVQKIQKIIQNHIQYIKDKEAKCLEEFVDKLKVFRKSYDKKAVTQDEDCAFQSKNNEFNEQKITFIYSTEQICKTIQGLTGTEEEVEGKINKLMRDYSWECVSFRTGLPIYAKRNAIIKKVKAHQVVVLQAETGSGKSTQVCQYLWRENFGENGMIVCTQPRKIAAISIANHVSSQIGSAVGGIVGYQVGLAKRMSEKTKILYVTDFTMLKMCAGNPLFNGISCIMIDEAHERSVHTDLLLGMVKRALGSRPDLRVIITSATIQCSLFKDYFALPDSAIYHVPGRTFPIEDVWFNEDVKVGWDYLGKTVRLTHQIVQEATGDILAFLTTPVETEKALEQLQDLLKNGSCKFDVHVLQLHGKLDINEQRKVFEKTKPNVRKVVFATNCAETSITIPGVRYVVDCGMVKEAQYDAVRNLNILSVGFTNRSSAEQRRGRAGRMQSGKCYRLYSKSNYENDMTDGMVPEILRINLGQALLKLMILGIRDPTEFDFIVSPSRASMDSALKQLVHLGAVNHSDKSLTEFGKKMSLLPLEPRLCYIILKAIEEGIGYDAVVIAALATVSRNIFFRNSGNSKEADAKKIRFCQSESDFLTFLEIYKEWSEVPKTEKSRWCYINCINARSMRLAQELINELLLTLSKELNHKVSEKFSKQGNFVEMIHQLIFFSFSENICVFSGHSKLGYRSFDVSENLYIHPSSSLCSLGSWRPQYVVYDAILKTSQTFLINLTVVHESVFENSSNDFIKMHIDRLKSLVLTPYVFCELGDIVLKTVLGKKANKIKMLEQNMKKVINSEYCATEVDFPNGKLSIFVPLPYYSEVKSVFLPHIKEVQSRLVSWEQEINEIAGLPHLGAIVGAGIEIREILLPGDFREVKITPGDYNFHQLTEDLRKCGEIVSVRKGNKYHRVCFKKVAYAKKAVKNFEKHETISIKPLDVPAYNNSLPFFKILAHLSRRLCTGNVFCSIQPSSSFPEALHKLSSNPVYYKGHLLKIMPSKKVNDDLYVSNLPQIVDQQELRSVLDSHLPSGIKVNKLIIILQPEFKSSDSDIELIKSKIMEMFIPFTLSKKLYVDLKPPRPKDKEWQAIVYFENPQDGQIAVNVLKSRKSYMSDMERSILKLNPLLETSLICHKDVFSAIKGQINDAVQFFNHGTITNDKLEIQAKLKDDGINVLIQISSNNIADINDARRSLLTLIQGDQIHCSGKPQLEKLFSNKGQIFLKNLASKQPESYINIDKRNKILSLFGSDASCTYIKSNLNSFLDDVEHENFAEIQLKVGNSLKSVLKGVITTFGFNLSKLQAMCHLSSAEINVYKHTLTVSGEISAIEHCKQLISDIKSNLAIDAIGNKEPAENCPVCCSERDELFHRLEYCGHVYCKLCLCLQVTSCESFPLYCCKEGCNKPLVLEDIQWTIKEGQLKESELYSKAFTCFMTKTKDFKYCPTPDCPMIYRVSSDEEYSEFNCPQCGNSICTSCCVVYHAGMSCNFYQSFKINDDHSLKVWMKADPENHKLCPNCHSPIEKNGGCTHMTCWKCQCHMCWRCMMTFPSGDEVYTHQSACPVMLRAMYS